jgi:hypothetical protein
MQTDKSYSTGIKGGRQKAKHIRISMTGEDGHRHCMVSEVVAGGSLPDFNISFWLRTQQAFLELILSEKRHPCHSERSEESEATAWSKRLT